MLAEARRGREEGGRRRRRRDRRSSRGSCRSGSSRRATGSGVKVEGAAAKALVAQVGERQQRLLRELEKLALEHGEGRARSASRRSRAPRRQSAERQIWGLVDAMVGGDRALATRAFLELRAQGETLPRLVPLMARRIRDVLAIADPARGGRVARAGEVVAADGPVAGGPAHQGGARDRRRSAAARARGAGRARAREPRQQRSSSEDTAALQAIASADRGAMASATIRSGSGGRPALLGAGARAGAQLARPGTSCARRRCGAARRA